jgi:hypothetical protein
MKDFNNTFIFIKHLTFEQITSLHLKYIDVLEKSGCLTACRKKTTNFLWGWNYLCVQDSFISYTDERRSYLIKECKLKEITEQDLDNYLKEQDNMSEYKYESVTGLSIIDVVAAMISGDEFYVYSSEGYSLIPMNVSLSLLIDYINKESLYHEVEVVVEAPWWDKHKNIFVAVRDYEYRPWEYDVFIEYSNTCQFPFRCKYAGWRYMRLLTQDEKDAIITQEE